MFLKAPEDTARNLLPGHKGPEHLNTFTFIQILNRTTMKLLMVILVHGGITASLPTTPIKYTLYPGFKTWNEVYAICQAQDQHMLTPDTLTKYNYFQEIAADWKNNSLLTNDYWTGLHQSQPNDNQSSLRWSSDCAPLGWAEWGAPTEPDHLATHRCIRLHDSEVSGFRTRACNSKYHTVCEKYTGECTFELFKLHTTSGLTIAWRTKGLTTQECMDACRNYSSVAMECVAFHQTASPTMPACYFLARESVFVKSDPVLVADSGTNTYVKRCIEGVYESTAPDVTPNDNMVPVVSCNSSVEGASSATSLSTQTELLSSSPVPAPGSVSSIITTPIHEVTSPLTTSVHITVDSTFQTPFASVTSLLVPSVPETADTSFQSTYESGNEMTSTLLSGVHETVSTSDSSFQSASLLEMTPTLMPSVDATARMFVTDTSSSLSDRKELGWPDSSSKLSTKTESLFPSKVPSSWDSMTSSDQKMVTSGIPNGIITTLNDVSLAPTKSIVNVVTDCPCSCRFKDLLDLEHMDLALDRKKVSAYRRSKTSASDDRPSAQAIGKTGIAILAFVFVFIVCMDIDRVAMFVHDIFEKKSSDRL
ncbi:uncharacterized protein [Haliotis asinina]|uniref:uncharacterized protein n=1 Tax=Haliotis asinina TaxID=109174 RepID=UPI0035321F02